jgi:hypothetical protein
LTPARPVRYLAWAGIHSGLLQGKARQGGDEAEEGPGESQEEVGRREPETQKARPDGRAFRL